MKKKKVCEKKNGAGMGWATAQLCHDTMGNRIVTQQVLGGLNGWWVVSQYTKCIVKGEAWTGGACHNTLRVL